jgi:hypothetical protein
MGSIDVYYMHCAVTPPPPPKYAQRTEVQLPYGIVVYPNCGSARSYVIATNVLAPSAGLGTDGISPSCDQRTHATSAVATRKGTSFPGPKLFGKPGLQLPSSSPHQPCRLITPNGKSGALAPRVENSRRHARIIAGSMHA